MSWQTITLTVPEQLKDAIVGEFSSDGIAGVWERELPSNDAVELVLETQPDMGSPNDGSTLARPWSMLPRSQDMRLL